MGVGRLDGLSIAGHLDGLVLSADGGVGLGGGAGDGGGGDSLVDDVAGVVSGHNLEFICILVVTDDVEVDSPVALQTGGDGVLDDLGAGGDGDQLEFGGTQPCEDEKECCNKLFLHHWIINQLLI